MPKSRTDRFVRILQFCLLLFFWSVCVSVYSIKAERQDAHERGFAARSVIDLRDAARTLSNFVKVAISPTDHQEITLEDTEGLFPIGKLQELSNVPDHLYLLFYRFEGGDAGTVYLKNVKNGEVERQWDIPLREVFQDLQALNKSFSERYATGELAVELDHQVVNEINAIQINSPILVGDGDLIFQCGGLGHTYRLNKNSKIVWKSKEVTHHSIEADADGNIWACAIDTENKIAHAGKFREDAVLCLDANGKTKKLYSISRILQDNGLFNSLANSTPTYKQSYGSDPYHLNDVLPVEADGPFWKKGDVFLCLRHKSLVLLFRPSDESVVWYKQGPWLTQHDVGILSDDKISVFNNNFGLLSNPQEGSNIAIYNFADDSVEFVADGMFFSKTEGRQARTENGVLLVEETNRGIYLLIDANDEIIARFYLPYYSNASNAMNPTWSRFYLKRGEEFEIQQ